MAQLVKNLMPLPEMPERRVGSLSQDDPLEKELAIHSCGLAWKMPWTEEPGGLRSMGLKRVGDDFPNEDIVKSQCLRPILALKFSFSCKTLHFFFLNFTGDFILLLLKHS